MIRLSFGRSVWAVFCLLAVPALSLRAQVLPKQEVAVGLGQQHWALGVTGGWASNTHVTDLSQTYFSDMRYSGIDGLSAGLSARYYFLKWVAARVDVAWVQKNYQMVRSTMYGPQKISLFTETTNNYLQLPVMAVLSAGSTVRPYVFGGAYVGYWLSSRRAGQTHSLAASLYDDDAANEFDERVELDARRDNRFDAGWVWGGGLSLLIAKKVEVGAEARWYYGLTDIQKQYMDHLSPRYNTTFVVQGGVSYWF